MKLIIDIPDMIYNILSGDSSWKGLSIDYILNAVKDGTPLETQPTDAEREAYIKGYDYGVKDWFKSKTQPTNVVDRDAVINLINHSLCDLKRDGDKKIFINTVNSLPSITPQRPKGKWIEVEVHNCHATLKCSVCNRVIEPTFTFGEYSYEDIKTFYPYCHCGAEMSGGDSE